MINKSNLMIGDIVNSPRDLKRMKITELKSETVILKFLDSDETSERTYNEIDPLTFFDDRIFKAIGFIDREIKTTAWEPAKVDRIVQLFDPEDNQRFFTITVVKKDKWFAEILDNNFSLIGSGTFDYVHDLQNVVRSCTGLEFTANNL